MRCARRSPASSMAVAIASHRPAMGKKPGEYLERGGRASVIVLDLVLPRMDGRLFRVKQLEHDELARIPVIVFTATAHGLPDVVAVVRKTDPESLLDIIDRAASVPALEDH
jgi:CheY-like chemotaxis protein